MTSVKLSERSIIPAHNKCESDENNTKYKHR